MQLKNYEEATEWLFQQFPSYQNIGAPAYKPDLTNIRLLCHAFGDPQNELRFIHIAGTNGKGSTSSMLASILTESGEKVGLFTSPHIKDFRERIRVNGQEIAELDVISICNKVLKAELNFEPSFFEITFLMALVHFKKSVCTVCVIETGLGGRLDATNIITPLLSVITNISLEHTQFLGNTIESIAQEKAGIIKPGVPVVIGEAIPESEKVFQRIAQTQNAEVIWCDQRPIDTKYALPLLGEYQKKNFRTVLATIERLNQLGFRITSDVIATGLKNLTRNTGFYGRMQVIGDNPLTILDASHNLEGIKLTLEAVKALNKGHLHIIYGSSSDKNYEEVVSTFPTDSSLNFCSFSNMRSITVPEWEAIATSMHSKPPVYGDVKDAIKQVQTLANKTDTILVFGSFFLISDFF
jgi:dihydrofolate synthase/folylpolyglutamate synthase